MLGATPISRMPIEIIDEDVTVRTIRLEPGAHALDQATDRDPPEHRAERPEQKPDPHLVAVVGKGAREQERHAPLAEGDSAETTHEDFSRLTA